MIQNTKNSKFKCRENLLMTFVNVGHVYFFVIIANSGSRIKELNQLNQPIVRRGKRLGNKFHFKLLQFRM